MNGRRKPPPPSCGFQFYSTFRPFPLMNTGLISGLVKEEAVNEVAGFQGLSHEEPPLSAEKKRPDCHDEVNWRLQGRGARSPGHANFGAGAWVSFALI